MQLSKLLARQQLAVLPDNVQAEAVAMLLAKRCHGLPAAAPLGWQPHIAARTKPMLRQTAGRSVLAGGLKENVAQLAPIDAVKEVQISGARSGDLIIPNAPGKKASVAIYAHLAAKHGGKVDAAAAEEGLQLYGEFVEEATETPGSHPSIDLLLQVVEQQLVLDVAVVPL